MNGMQSLLSGKVSSQNKFQLPLPGELQPCLREAGDSESLRFWTTIRHLRSRKQCTVVYIEDGVPLTSTQDAVDRWKEYFEDLLNPSAAPSGEEAGPRDPVGLSCLTRVCVDIGGSAAGMAERESGPSF